MYKIPWRKDIVRDAGPGSDMQTFCSVSINLNNTIPVLKLIQSSI